MRLPFPVANDVIKEDAANAAVLLASRNVKVLVCPMLEAVIQTVPMLIAYVLPECMKFSGIVVKQVGGSQVAAAPIPGCRFNLCKPHHAAEL